MPDMALIGFMLSSRADQEGHLQIAKLLLDAKAVSG